MVAKLDCRRHRFLTSALRLALRPNGVGRGDLAEASPRPSSAMGGLLTSAEASIATERHDPTRSRLSEARTEPASAETAQLEREGYAIIRGLFTPEEVAELREEIGADLRPRPARHARQARARGHGDVPLRHAQPQRRGAARGGPSGLLEVIEPLLGEDCHVIANTAWRNPAGHPGIARRPALAHRRRAACPAARGRALAGRHSPSGVRRRRPPLPAGLRLGGRPHRRDPGQPPVGRAAAGDAGDGRRPGLRGPRSGPADHPRRRRRPVRLRRLAPPHADAGRRPWPVLPAGPLWPPRHRPAPAAHRRSQPAVAPRPSPARPPTANAA